MNKQKQTAGYFSRAEIALWGISVLLIVGSFFRFDRENYMTLAASLISWLRNPFEGCRSEVRVNTLAKGELRWMWVAAAVVTALFYLLLEHFLTANIVPSTISVTTSFLAVYLTFRRSPYFALAYAANDLVLIVLWLLASMEDVRYVSVVVCFAAFLVNDLYGFASWQKRKLRQALEAEPC